MLYLKPENMQLVAEQYGDAIYGFCRRLANSKDEADDLYQQTFLRAMELCSKIDENGNPKCFLIGIAVNLSRNRKSKAMRRAELAPESELKTVAAAVSAQNTENEVQNRILFQQLVRYADELPEKLRLALLLYYGMQLSVEETASALKVPQGTVKNRLFKARQILRKKLEEDGYDTF